jgi:2-C-methyl-D-erythritol 4-phosphate cytidylyltransferase
MAANDHPIVAAILVAAGSGERLGADVPKAFVPVAGRALLDHAATRFTAHPDVRDVIVVVPDSHLDAAAALVPTATVVAGGATRQQSVSAGLEALAEDVGLVLVHDVARAFAPAEVISRVVAALADASAVIPVLPVTDTIRRSDPETGELHETVDRSRLSAVQTPQGFRRAELLAAHLEASADATDDASLVEARGGRVLGVAGDALAFKITYPLDLVLAEAVANGGATLAMGAPPTQWGRPRG